MVASAIDQLGGLNYLINCAGISASGKLHEGDLADSEAILNTNLRAHMYLARHALPEINREPGGAVIKIGSVNHPYSGVNTYLASNRGGEGLAEALFEDVREYGTRVCTIRPGWVRQRIREQGGAPSTHCSRGCSDENGSFAGKSRLLQIVSRVRLRSSGLFGLK